MIKKIISFILGMAFGLVLLILLGIAGHIETHYTMECEVVKVDGDIITLEDECGYLWEVENQPLKLHQTCKVTFFIGNTDSAREDDEIVKIRVDK